MSYSAVLQNPASFWPHLAPVPVELGGAVVAYAEAVAAVQLLAASRTSAIAPVLKAARSPLAACDYFAAAAPHLARARALPPTGHAGAAGRHLTKVAFAAAVAAALEAARADATARALVALGTDERYAAQIAADAVELRRREHAGAIRRRAEGDIARAMSACAAAGGSCALEAACGTGKCPYAPPWLAPHDAPAGPGRYKRPPVHENAGTGFSPAAAIAAAVEAAPFALQPRVSDHERCAAAERAA